MKKIILILIAILISACAQSDEYQRYQSRTTEAGFDTSIEFLAYTKTEAEFNQYFDILKQEYYRYHQLFDKYNDYEGIHNLKTINDNAGIRAIEVDPAIIELLLLAQRYSEITDGYFDITLGAVLNIWHQYRENGVSLNDDGLDGEVPDLAMLEAAKQLTGWHYVEIDETANTVYLNEVGVSLDVGAIAKGYATEMVALKLEEAGLTMGVVSGGGNIRTINTKPDNEPWVIGIEKPALITLGESVDAFSIPHSVSIVTSGDYQRYYFGPDGIRYNHLIDPSTLFPASNYRSVSVITENSTMADALSTALFMMEYEQALQFIADFNTDYPESPIDVFWIVDTNPNWHQYDDFSYMMTLGLENYSRNLNQSSD